MIYSKLLKQEIPVQIYSKSYDLMDFGKYTNYIVKDNRINVGKVNLLDIDNGVRVMMIRNENPDLYKGFGKLADQLEVEHCLKRGLKSFKIVSDAAFNSHALHYLRGKRFVLEEINEKVRNVIANTPKGELFNTRFLGNVAMFMPKDMIEKYMEIIKKFPLLH